MNCFQHTDVTAVATCAQGCGRSLCPECAEEFEPPTCNICASAIKNNTIAEVTQERSTIIKRMVINAVFLLAYVFLFINAQKNNQNPAVLWVMIPIFIWGFIAFRWLMDAFYRVTGFITFDTLQGWGFKYLMGSIITSMFGLLVIPILIFMQWRQLNKIPKVA